MPGGMGGAPGMPGGPPGMGKIGEDQLKDLAARRGVAVGVGLAKTYPRAIQRRSAGLTCRPSGLAA